jgi:hypothetical protein
MKLYFFSIIFALLFIGCASQMSLEQILSITPKSQYNQNERSIAIRSSERAEYEVWLKIYKGYEGVDNEAYFYATLYQVEENPVAMNTINTRLALKFEQELATELGIEVVDIQRIWEEGLRKGWPLRYKDGSE